ncbi:MAG: acyl-CoA dehydrogenase family protein [Pseudomonadota bacterium]
MNFEYTDQERQAQMEFARFCKEEIGPQSDRMEQMEVAPKGDALRAQMRLLGSQGYLGLNQEHIFGGQGKGLLYALPFFEHMARNAASVFVAAEASAFLAGGLIAKIGSEAQKEKYIKKIIKGELLAAFCVTEPHAGSDIYAMSTIGSASQEGWVLDGTKSMITNAPYADIFVVLAVTKESGGENALSFFLVERNTKGLTIGEPEPTMGLCGTSISNLVFSECKLERSTLLGSTGQGHAIYEDLSTSARIRLASFCVGLQQAAIELALAFATERKVGGHPLFKQQEVSFKLADMQTETDGSQQLARYAAWLHDQSNPQAYEISCCAKLFASEAASKASHAAQQIFGGQGYLKKSAVEQLYRDARYAEIGGGTSEMQRIWIANQVLAEYGHEQKKPGFTSPKLSRRIGVPKQIPRKVAICAVAMTNFVRDNWQQRFQGMGLDVLESLLEETGLDFSENGGINTAINVSDDVFDARTISDNAMTDVLGAHFCCEEKVAQDGAQAVYYGLATILSGHTDLVLIIGHCKESQGQSRNMVTHLAFDPFYTRPVGLDFCNAAALQAQAYMSQSKVTELQLAQIVERARSHGAKNPHTSTIEQVTADEVKLSPMLSDPIRSLHAYPVSDGAVGLILASAERAKELVDVPIWITGVGNCFDSFFLGDRDLTSNFALKKASERAYARAGIADPMQAFDVVELSDQYAYQLPMWSEGVGLCAENKGGQWLQDGGHDRNHVNFSGGMLAGNPLILGGLVRVAEAALQLRGEAGANQVQSARRALAHGVMGPAGQFHSVVVLERD